MAATNPNAANNLLSTHRALLDTITTFLTVVTHQILYLRHIYPPVSFVSTRAYQYPVRQNRHPDVCRWITDAVAAVRDQLEKNAVENVAICIFECGNNQVLERWTINLHSLPIIHKYNHDVALDSAEEPELESEVNLADLDANFRAVLSRLSTSTARMQPLPEGDGAPECSFTMTIEVKENADRPVGRVEERERQWTATEPQSFSSLPADQQQGKTHAVRRLEVGEIRLEIWAEESAAKFKFPVTEGTAARRRKELSDGVDFEQFDPMHGYELEKPDINRKPGGGTSTDYQRV